jgi:hypothetical protein
MKNEPPLGGNHPPEPKSNSLEKKEVPPHLTIEYYRNKSNGIERHLDDVLQAALFKLATIDRKHFENDCKWYDKHLADSKRNVNPGFDALDIKVILQLSYLPRLTDGDFEDFNKSIQSFGYFSEWESKLVTYLERLPTKERDLFEEKRDELNERGVSYWESIEHGEVEGLEIVSAGGVPAIFTELFVKKSPKKGYRVNIKVDPLSPETSTFILSEIVKRLHEKKGAMESGFGTKIMGGESTRDGIIIYSTPGAFTDIAEVVTEYFDNNDSYHDRHAEKGIMFGVPLETADRHKFPGIRVTSEPKKPFSTFNTLQAEIVSPAIINYIRKYYHGDHTEMLRQFRNDYYDAYLLWEQNFPQTYKDAVKEVLGNSQQLDNIAFLAEDDEEDSSKYLLKK